MADTKPTSGPFTQESEAKPAEKPKARTFQFKNKRGDVIRTQNKGYARQLRQDSNFTEIDK